MKLLLSCARPLLFCALLLGLPSWAENPNGPPNLTTETAPDYIKKFTVLVENNFTNLFHLDLDSGHGSGFVIELSAEKAVVMTNRHVVNKGPRDAQRITLEISAAPGILPERIEAEVVFRSGLYDMAILEFDPRKLTRSKVELAPLPMLGEGQALRDYLPQGRAVMAYGHPNDGHNISTPGIVSGDDYGNENGLLIQTSAAINPGNSGGPLVDLVTGKVVGMNSSYLADAQGTAYALPIHVLLEEYNYWRVHGAGYEIQKRFPAQYELLDKNALNRAGFEPAILAALPNFFTRFLGMHIVIKDHPESHLMAGDLIVSCNGIVFGEKWKRLEQSIQRSQSSTVALEILRKGELVNINVPVAQAGRVEEELDAKFTIFSGLVVREQSYFERALMRSGLLVVDVLPGSYGARESVAEGSVLQGVQFKDEAFQHVTTLRELNRLLSEHKEKTKAARKANPDAKDFMAAYIHARLVVESDEGTLRPSDFYGNPIQRAELSYVQLLFGKVIQSRQINMNRLRREFELNDGLAVSDNDWEAYIVKRKARKCGHTIVTGQSPKAT